MGFRPLKIPPDWPWLAASVGLHLALVVFAVVLATEPPAKRPGDSVEVIRASVIDGARIDQQRAAQSQAERARRDAAAEREREAARQREEAEQQARREEEARRAEEQRQARERREAEEQARREAEAEEQRRREAEAEAAARREREAEQEAEAQRQREADQRRREELAAALEREEQQRRQQSLSAEQERALGLYRSAIADRVQRNWLRPPAETEEFECRVRVRQAPGGEVLDARIVQSCGNAALDRSVEAAVLRSSPLPSPPEPELFRQELEFVFVPR